ncbi:hypothetical protein DYB37_003042 [Aphanomyces astaci]|uniref:GAF domain-containing protein n=1 Tax=Aphanomyces astaci TaxID=112090 RepID=A0A3R7C4X0_APHAT|nr:hypothetical protein DYB35_003097 [Aphanomyces astaci]RHZ33658.1 hypothetical protein DYB37_003042 [Aphanomyces astaci]
MNCVLVDAEVPDNALTVGMRENSATASSLSSRSLDCQSHVHNPPSSPSGASSHAALDIDDDAINTSTCDDPLDYSWRYPWPKAPVLADEDVRLDVLRSYNILDSAPEEKFDIACTLAANSMKCPLAVVSFMDSERQWFKANVGLAQAEIPRNVSFCAHAAKSSEPMVVWNTMLDVRFVKNPLVTGSAAIRFYAGVPLVAPTGHVVGTVAVFDNQPRQSVDVAMLEKLATVVMKYLEERRGALAAPSPQTPRQLRQPSDAATAPCPGTASQAALFSAPVSTVAVPDAPAAPGANMEMMLMTLLSKTTETQQQLASQQGAMFNTLGQHTEQIDKLADAVARMEAKLLSPSVNETMTT